MAQILVEVRPTAEAGDLTGQPAQGQYAKPEPLLQRALAIREKALGPEHPYVATFLENYALSLRDIGNRKEVVPLEARARAIRAKSA